MHYLHRLRPKLIAQWRRAHRLWSVRLSALGMALSGAWTAMPPDLRAHIPAPEWVGLALFALIAASRIIAQAERP